MKHLTILVPKGENNLSSIVGTFKIFTRANDYRRQQGRQDLFKIELAGLSKKVDYHEGIFSVRPHKHISEIRKTDLAIIPAIGKDYNRMLSLNQQMIPWIHNQYTKGSEIASICTGAFLLAATGLLKDRSCSTHWAMEQAFRKMFPEVNLQAGKLITDEKGIYTNGGAYSFLHLVLYLVEKYYDRETAIFCSKVFQVDIDRNSQSPFTIFSTQHNHQDELVKKAQDLIEQSREEELSSEQIANRLAISRRNFDRRFINATGFTPAEYRKRVKVELAKKAFESSRKQIQEVMYDVGYNDVKAFREVFRSITGLTPLEYRARYNRELSQV